MQRSWKVIFSFFNSDICLAFQEKKGKKYFQVPACYVGFNKFDFLPGKYFFCRWYLFHSLYDQVVEIAFSGFTTFFYLPFFIVRVKQNARISNLDVKNRFSIQNYRHSVSGLNKKYFSFLKIPIVRKFFE